MIIAGDISGDVHASGVVRELWSDFPEMNIWGIGGPKMQAEGFSALLPFEPFNRMGFLEVISHLPFFLSAKKLVIDEMKSRRPDCLILVDYPGFNMPVMKAAHSLGIPVLWYIAPMVWAWKRKRAEVLGKLATHIACIFPFEVQYFTPFTSSVSFVGNPLMESVSKISGKKDSLDEGEIDLAIVPGSRAQEVKKMLPEMISAYRILKECYPRVKARVSRCGPVSEQFYRDAIRGTDANLFDGNLRELLRRSDLALVTSGTATLETALEGVPMVIAYRTSMVTYHIFKRLLRIPHIGLPNIIAGERIVPECIQEKSDAEQMAAELQGYIENPETYRSTLSRLSGLRDLLGSKKPSREVSDIAGEIIRRSVAGR